MIWRMVSSVSKYWHKLSSLSPISSAVVVECGPKALPPFASSLALHLPTIQTLKIRYSSSWVDHDMKTSTLDQFSHLQSLTIASWSGRKLGLECLPGSLQVLKLRDCRDLEDIGALSKLSSLRYLELRACTALCSIPEVKSLENLQSFQCSICPEVDLYTALGYLRPPILTTLDLSLNGSLTTLEDANGPSWNLSNLSSLVNLNLHFCANLVDVGPLSSLPWLQTLNLSSCSSLSNLGPLSSLSSLQILDLRYCVSLVDVGPLSSLSSLQTLDLRGCSSVVDVDSLSSLSSLRMFPP